MDQHVVARINENGRIVIPASFRKALGLEPGDAVVLSLEGGQLLVEPHRARVARIQDEFEPYASGQSSAAQDLVDESRSQAVRLVEEWLG